jgi:hypothetical protein
MIWPFGKLRDLLWTLGFDKVPTLSTFIINFIYLVSLLTALSLDLGIHILERKTDWKETGSRLHGFQVYNLHSR